MVEYVCTVQEKQLPEELKPDLTAGLQRLSGEILDMAARDVSVRFREVPRGAGYRGGVLSTTSVIRGTVPAGCNQAVRERLLRAVCDMWTEITGCDEDEVVVSAVDEDYVSRVL